MATSGSINLGSGSNSTTLIARWQIVSQSIENNTSTVSITYSLGGNVSSIPTGETGVSFYASFTANGMSGSYSNSVNGAPGRFTYTAGSQTVVVNHSANGNGSFQISGNFSVTGKQSGTTFGSGSGSGWAVLNAIPRQATLVSVSNFNDEENPTITYSNPAGNSIASLDACISLDGSNPDIPYRAISKTGTSYTFNLTEEERRILRLAVDGSKSRTVLFYVRSILGEQYYFSYKEATLTIINGEPEIISSVVDTNETTIALTGDNKKLIKYFSNAYAYMNMVLYKESYATAYYIENGGIKADTSYSHTFNAVESNVFNFYVADNRNNGIVQSYDAPMVNYVKLTCNYEAETMAAAGSMTVRCSGNYFNGSFGAAANTLTVQYRYKAQGGSYGSWQTMTISKSGNTYNATANITGLNYKTTYVFQCRATDALMQVSSAETVVRSLPVFHWGENDFVFEVPVTFNAGAELAGNASTEAGSWMPTLTTSAAVSSYSMRQGWYSKVGNVVSIGWQIKATINSGYNSTTVAISGCPYTPIYAAFGGGVAHNVNLSAGFCFEGWCIGTDGNITMRAQPCNGTAAGNLNITSAAYYPTGSGNVLTLSGSIVFTV